MDQIINTGILFISRLLKINAVAISKEEKIILPSIYTLESENQKLQQIAEQGKENMVCIIKNQFQLIYIIVLLTEKNILLGPFKEEERIAAERKKQLPFSQQESLMKFLKYYHTVPNLTLNEAKLAAYTLILSIYGSTKDTTEMKIDAAYNKNCMQWHDEIENKETEHQVNLNQKLSLRYMENIKNGDYISAIDTYEEIMKKLPKFKKFDRICTIEGLSILVLDLARWLLGEQKF